MPKAIRDKALAVGPNIVETLRRAHGEGIKIAFGTDTAVSPHGENAREFLLMVQAGMTPMEAIVAATVTASQHLGHPELGSLEPGNVADLIATAKSPLDDIGELTRTCFVMRGGQAFKSPPHRSS
jgi:imidazolonepropionase-like amidohydrolase